MSKDLPDRIYLQAYDDDGQILDSWDRTHCEDQINDSDVEYVRLLEGQVVVWRSQLDAPVALGKEGSRP